MKKYISIDVGGSSIKHGLLTSDGTVLSTASVATPKDTESFVATIKDIQASYQATPTAGIAISMPGLVDSVSGHIVHGGALHYIRDINIKKLLQDACQVPLEIENDGKCAALGEHWLGNLVGVSNGIALVLGTGVGGGLIMHNKLVRGHHLSAGEFSFIQTNSESDDLQYVLAMQGSVQMLCLTYAKLKNIPEDEINGKLFFADVNAGDEVAISLLQGYTQKLAKQLFNLQTVLDPERITIGGGISKQEVLIEYINQHIDNTLAKAPIPMIRPQIVQSSLGNKANLIGALVNFFEKTTDNKGE